MPRLQTGLTLIEAVIALLILSILIGIGTPALANAWAGTRIAALKAEVYTDVLQATNHALATRTHVVMCPTRAGQNGCVRGSDWTDGWMVFADVDDDRAFGGLDHVLTRHAPLGGSLRMTSTIGRQKMVFQPDGGVTAGYNVTLTLCDRRARRQAGSVILANSGNIRHGVASDMHRQACLGDGG